MFFNRKIGIDLGTTNTLVFVPGQGIVINEPTVVAVTIDNNEVLAIGNEAKEMLGRTPEAIRAYKPLRDGVIADYKITEAMLRYFLGKVGGNIRLFRPDVIISVPAGVTSTERRAVIDAAVAAGAREAYVVREPVLAAIGAGIPINSPSGNLIINIGGGTTEVAVISLGGVVSWVSARIGGNKMDEAITDYIKRKHNLAIGERTAEKIKIFLASAIKQKGEDEESIEIRGVDLVAGLPKNIEIKSSEITEAIADELGEIVNVVKKVLRDTPPELAADIMDKGAIMTGGGALLKNLDKFLTKETGVPCYPAEDPLFCVAKGTGVVLENLETYKRSLMSKR